MQEKRVPQGCYLIREGDTSTSQVPSSDQQINFFVRGDWILSLRGSWRSVWSHKGWKDSWEPWSRKGMNGGLLYKLCEVQRCIQVFGELAILYNCQRTASIRSTKKPFILFLKCPVSFQGCNWHQGVGPGETSVPAHYGDDGDKEDGTPGTELYKSQAQMNFNLNLNFDLDRTWIVTKGQRIRKCVGGCQ